MTDAVMMGLRSVPQVQDEVLQPAQPPPAVGPGLARGQVHQPELQAPPPVPAQGGGGGAGGGGGQQQAVRRHRRRRRRQEGVQRQVVRQRGRAGHVRPHHAHAGVRPSVQVRKQQNKFLCTKFKHQPSL